MRPGADVAEIIKSKPHQIKPLKSLKRLMKSPFRPISGLERGVEAARAATRQGICGRRRRIRNLARPQREAARETAP
jgi:hypothetical protein